MKYLLFFILFISSCNVMENKQLQGYSDMEKAMEYSHNSIEYDYSGNYGAWYSPDKILFMGRGKCLHYALLMHYSGRKKDVLTDLIYTDTINTPKTHTGHIIVRYNGIYYDPCNGWGKDDQDKIKEFCLGLKDIKVISPAEIDLNVAIELKNGK